jgi:hypothetical protein
MSEDLASALTNINRKKLAALIARLATAFDAEVVAAARAIQRVLQTDGLDLNDLANAIAHLTPAPTPTRPPPPPPPNPAPPDYSFDGDFGDIIDSYIDRNNGQVLRVPLGQACRSCGARIGAIFRRGPHWRLECGACGTYIKFLTKAHVSLKLGEFERRRGAP